MARIDPEIARLLLRDKEAGQPYVGDAIGYGVSPEATRVLKTGGLASVDRPAAGIDPAALGRSISPTAQAAGLNQRARTTELLLGSQTSSPSATEEYLRGLNASPAELLRIKRLLGKPELEQAKPHATKIRQIAEQREMSRRQAQMNAAELAKRVRPAEIAANAAQARQVEDLAFKGRAAAALKQHQVDMLVREHNFKKDEMNLKYTNDQLVALNKAAEDHALRMKELTKKGEVVSEDPDSPYQIAKGTDLKNAIAEAKEKGDIEGTRAADELFQKHMQKLGEISFEARAKASATSGAGYSQKTTPENVPSAPDAFVESVRMGRAAEDISSDPAAAGKDIPPLDEKMYEEAKRLAGEKGGQIKAKKLMAILKKKYPWL